MICSRAVAAVLCEVHHDMLLVMLCDQPSQAPGVAALCAALACLHAFSGSAETASFTCCAYCILFTVRAHLRMQLAILRLWSMV
jgi:hypothetical protein